MANSQNGWTVHTGSSGLVPLRWVTGRVAPGDVHAVFDYLCRRFNAEVEPIIVSSSWGWAYRAIRGQSSGYSNHASGTAIDLNAPSHPLGKRGTFSAKQVAAIHAILRDLGGAVRWGGDYSGRPDEMHFEINTTPANLRKVAAGLNKERDPMADYAKQLDEIQSTVNLISRQLTTVNGRLKATRQQLTNLRARLMKEGFDKVAADLDAVLAELDKD